MSNTLIARIEFSFQGVDYDYASILDLDLLLAQHAAFPAISQLLAKIHHVDTYSYLYEVMAESDVIFSDALGIAAEFVRDGEFDVTALAANWSELKVLSQLQSLALQHLGLADLKAHPELQHALRLAYQLGQKA